MRTKTILLTAALAAAGVASSMAQGNVYSLNVVGYVNITLKPGYNLITAPLSAADNGVNTVLKNCNPPIPANSLLFTWDSVNATYAQALTADGANGWVDSQFNPATTQIPPGTAFFVQNAGAAPVTLTLTGTVLQNTNPVALAVGYSFIGDTEPLSADITTNGFPVVDNSLLYTWDATGQTYNQALTGQASPPAFLDSQFNPVVVAPSIGQGFIYFNPAASAATWNRAFTVQ